MQIDITGQHIEITAALRQRVEKTLERISKRTDAVFQRAHIVLETNKRRHCCDVQLDVNGSMVIAKSESDDMYAAIDQAMEKINSQLKTAKGRNDKRSK